MVAAMDRKQSWQHGAMTAGILSTELLPLCFVSWVLSPSAKYRKVQEEGHSLSTGQASGVARPFTSTSHFK